MPNLLEARWPSSLVVIVAFATVLTACGAGHEPSRHRSQSPTRTSPAPTAPATTSTAAGSVEDQVATAYRGIVHRYYLRLRHPDPDDPALARDHAGRSLAAVVANERRILAEHGRTVVVSGSTPTPQILDVRVVGRRGTVRNCLVDDTTVIETTSHRPLNDDVVTYLLDSTLVRTNGRWRLTDQVQIERTMGRKRCPS